METRRPEGQSARLDRQSRITLAKDSEWKKISVTLPLTKPSRFGSWTRPSQLRWLTFGIACGPLPRLG